MLGMLENLPAMGESPLPKRNSRTKLFLLSTSVSVSDKANGLLGNTATIRIYGWHHGLDHDSVH